MTFFHILLCVFSVLLVFWTQKSRLPLTWYHFSCDIYFQGDAEYSVSYCFLSLDWEIQLKAQKENRGYYVKTALQRMQFPFGCFYYSFNLC